MHIETLAADAQVMSACFVRYHRRARIHFACRRTAFTEDDEANLCTWIAAVIPFKESGGRTGNKIYQELVSRVCLNFTFDLFNNLMFAGRLTTQVMAGLRDILGNLGASGTRRILNVSINT